MHLILFLHLSLLQAFTWSHLCSCWRPVLLKSNFIKLVKEVTLNVFSPVRLNHMDSRSFTTAVWLFGAEHTENQNARERILSRSSLLWFQSCRRKQARSYFLPSLAEVPRNPPNTPPASVANRTPPWETPSNSDQSCCQCAYLESFVAVMRLLLL